MSAIRDVGILAMEWYTSSNYVEQRDLEVADRCVGKYVTGLGQERMGFVDDREDIGSIFLTTLSRLLQNYGIDGTSQVGRLEVGTETLIDKSKSIKTSLLSLVSSDCEGCTSLNACYGGTAALLNSIAWVESSAWDGRYAVVICGDIAVYEAGPARPSGGCGAVAMLVGPNAPLVLEPKRATWAMDVWDFYKPRHSEYATVDGKLSQAAYLESVDRCWARLRTHCAEPDIDFVCFHSPYNKLVQKGIARLVIAETPRDKWPEQWRSVDLPGDNDLYRACLGDKRFDSFARGLSADFYADKVLPSTLLPKNVGNTYTASLFFGLLSLISAKALELDTNNKRVLLFSYGSGSIATAYIFRSRRVEHRFTLKHIAQIAQVQKRLDARQQQPPAVFAQACRLREAAYGKAPYKPVGVLPLAPKVYYLDFIDHNFRRTYKQTPP